MREHNEPGIVLDLLTAGTLISVIGNPPAKPTAVRCRTQSIAGQTDVIERLMQSRDENTILIVSHFRIRARMLLQDRRHVYDS